MAFKVTPSTRKLFQAAVKAYKKAYAPYSKFKVGAAIAKGSKIYSGCNVENCSYGGTICAERTAILKAVSEGLRKFDQLIVVSNTPKGVAPCALCLQTISEFCSGDLVVWIANTKEIHSCLTLQDLLPKRFTKKDL